MIERADRGPEVVIPAPLLFLADVAVGWLVALIRPWRPFWHGPVPGVPFILAGMGLAFWAVATLRAAGTSPNPAKETARLVTEGPFGFTRNPIYVAMASVTLGFGLWDNNGWIVMLLIPALAALHFGVIRKEERYLSEKFGATYDAYRKKVRRWL